MTLLSRRKHRTTPANIRRQARVLSRLATVVAVAAATSLSSAADWRPRGQSQASSRAASATKSSSFVPQTPSSSQLKWRPVRQPVHRTAVRTASQSTRGTIQQVQFEQPIAPQQPQPRDPFESNLKGNGNEVGTPKPLDPRDPFDEDPRPSDPQPEPLEPQPEPLQPNPLQPEPLQPEPLEPTQPGPIQPRPQPLEPGTDRNPTPLPPNVIPDDTPSSREQRLRENDLAKSRAECADADAFQRELIVSKIGLDIDVHGQQGTDFPFECAMESGGYDGRHFPESTFEWKASALCHKPLYFEEENLERYGHEFGPHFQHIASGAHFFGHLALLPYKMGLKTPNECVYALGHYRPGSCYAPFGHALGFTPRAALFQGAAIGGAVALIP